MLRWSPLARGLLAGTRDKGGRRHTIRAATDELADRYYDDNDFDVVDAVRTVAEYKDATPAQVALAWLLDQPGVTGPIVGATKPHHLEEAIAALDVTLNELDRAQLESPYRPHPVLGHS